LERKIEKGFERMNLERRTTKSSRQTDEERKEILEKVEEDQTLKSASFPLTNTVEDFQRLLNDKEKQSNICKS